MSAGRVARAAEVCGCYQACLTWFDYAGYRKYIQKQTKDRPWAEHPEPAPQSRAGHYMKYVRAKVEHVFFYFS